MLSKLGVDTHETVTNHILGVGSHGSNSNKKITVKPRPQILLGTTKVRCRMPNMAIVI